MKFKYAIFLILMLATLGASISALAKTFKHSADYHQALKALDDSGLEYVFERSLDYNFESDRRYFMLSGETVYEFPGVFDKRAVTHAGFINIDSVNDKPSSYIVDSDSRKILLVSAGEKNQKSEDKQISIPAEIRRVENIFSLTKGLLISSGNTRQQNLFLIDLKTGSTSKHKILKKGEYLADVVERSGDLWMLVLDVDRKKITLKTFDSNLTLLSEKTQAYKGVIDHAGFLRVNETGVSVLIREVTKGLFSFNLGYKFSTLEADLVLNKVQVTEVFSMDSVRNGEPDQAVFLCKSSKELIWAEQHKGSVSIKSLNRNGLESSKSLSEWSEGQLPEKTFIRNDGNGNLFAAINFSKDLDGYYNHGFGFYQLEAKCPN